jgi:protein-S-isoprenylcysteine O-methyltransferase Ste14
MGLDIRWPIGLMFTLIGALLVLSGIVTGSNAEMYKRSLDININLYWGLLLLAFGATMLTLAWRGSKQSSGPDATAQSPKSKEMASH